jgi:hypothetical protein
MLSVADDELAMCIVEREARSARQPGQVEMLDVADDVVDGLLSPNSVEFLARSKQASGE